MVKEDFKEISETFIKSAKYVARYNGDCTYGEYIPCRECPFNSENTKKYACDKFEEKRLKKSSIRIRKNVR